MWRSSTNIKDTGSCQLSDRRNHGIATTFSFVSAFYL